MRTISLLEYDHDSHEFHPSFVIHDDLTNTDNECCLDELVLNPSAEWMEDYLEWNRFGRLNDDPDMNNFSVDDGDDTKEENAVQDAIPIFQSLQELYEFNTKGQELTQRLREELKMTAKATKEARLPKFCVAPFQPLYSNMKVGPPAAWWHLKDLNYDMVIPVQRLPLRDNLKARVQAFRCHKGMGLWQDPATLKELVQEGRDLERDLLLELSGREEQEKEAQEADVDTVYSGLNKKHPQEGETSRIAEAPTTTSFRTPTAAAGRPTAKLSTATPSLPCMESPRSVKRDLYDRRSGPSAAAHS